MNRWKNAAYYLGTLLLAALIIYGSNSAYLHYSTLYKHSFEQTIAQSAYLSHLGGALAVGLLLGLEALFRQRNTYGAWHFNYARVLFIGLPALLGSLWFIFAVRGWHIKIEQVLLFQNYQMVLALMAGWALGGSFYKEPASTVPLPVGRPDDQQA